MNQHQVIAAGYSACVALFDEGSLDAWALLGLDMLWDEAELTKVAQVVEEYRHQS